MVGGEIPGETDTDEGDRDRNRHQAVFGRLTVLLEWRGAMCRAGFGRARLGRWGELGLLTRMRCLASLGLEARFEVMLDAMAPAQCRGHADIAGDDGAQCENDERERHCGRRVVQ